MSDPRFPNRPDHPDFWLISETLVGQDAAADQGNEPFEDMVGRYVDMRSLIYMAENQAGLMLQRTSPNELVLGRKKVEIMIQSVFLAAFVHGIRFQIRKSQGDDKDLAALVDQHIVLVGDPIDGIDVYGPFDGADEANDFAEHNYPNETWWTVPVHKEAG